MTVYFEQAVNLEQLVSNVESLFILHKRLFICLKSSGPLGQLI